MNIDLSAARWFKSTYSESGGQCVEVAFLGSDLVGVRDSKDQHGPALIFTPAAWDAFTTGVLGGAFNRPA